MSQLIFPMILLGIVLIFGAVFLIIINKQKGTDKDPKMAGKNNSDPKNGEKKSNNNKNISTENVPKEDIFKFMDFDRIVDNMIVQNKGTKYTMAVRCKGINYDLMSDMEQLAVEEGFITFLNTLRYPIQLYVQAQNIDLKGAINTYKENASGIRNEFEDINKQYNELLNQFDAKKEDIERVEEQRETVLNVYEYASDIINYVEKLSLNKNLLQRNFYVLVSYYSSEITSTENFSKEETMNICYNELLTRAQSIISGLSACSVSGEVLESNELADLLYIAYNRDDKGLVGIKEAVQSGFYRLYSTSEDVFLKKQEKLQKEIQEVAEIKAMDAIKRAIDEGKYISKGDEQLDVLEKTNKAAAEIVKKEPISGEIKDKAKEILVDEYVQDKKKILEEMAEDRMRIERATGGIKADDSQNNEKNNENSTPSLDNNVTQDANINTNNNNNVQKDNNNFEIQNDSQVLDDRMGFSDNSNNSNQSEGATSSEDDLII